MSIWRRPVRRGCVGRRREDREYDAPGHDPALRPDAGGLDGGAAGGAGSVFPAVARRRGVTRFDAAVIPLDVNPGDATSTIERGSL
jgi:hypothetical protein